MSQTIIRVVPLRRMPKHIHELDYAVPKDMRPEVGSIVKIPLRKSQAFGIISAIDVVPPNSFKTKIISSIVTAKPLLDLRSFHIARIIAIWYGVNMGTVVKMMLPPLQPRKLSKLTLEMPSPSSIQKPGKDMFLHTNDSNLLSIELKKELDSLNGQTLFLCPTMQYANMIADLLEKDKQHDVFSTEMSKKQQFDYWTDVFTKERSIVIGTRSAVFLPFKQLKKIILLESGSSDHKHWDQSPRYHVEDIISLLRTNAQVDLVHVDHMFPPDLYEQIRNNRISMKKAIEEKEQPVLVDMQNERHQHNYRTLSFSLQERITSTDEEDIFLLMNRRGYATSYGCYDCSYTQNCPQCSLPFIYHEEQNILTCHYCNTHSKPAISCPQCKSTMLKLQGAGTELVENEVRTLIAQDQSREIVRIDPDVDDRLHLDTSSQKKRVVIGTLRALDAINWKKTTTIAYLSIDNQLALPEMRAQEDVYRIISYIHFMRSKSSTFYIQTRQPEALFFSSLENSEQFAQSILEQRKALAYPPYSYLSRYLIGKKTKEEAKKAAISQYHLLQKELTKSKKNIMINNPYELHPLRFRGNYWYAILIKIPKRTWKNDLLWLNTFFTQDWKIDPHPISLLHP